MTLKTSLQNSTDHDVAYHKLACALGMVTEDEWIMYKPIYNSNNKVNMAFFKMIEALKEIELITHDEDEDRLKWNTNFELDKWKPDGYKINKQDAIE